MIAIALVIITIIMVIKPPQITININKRMSIDEPATTTTTTTPASQEDMNTIYKELNKDVPPNLDDLMEAFNEAVHNISGGDADER